MSNEVWKLRRPRSPSLAVGRETLLAGQVGVWAREGTCRSTSSDFTPTHNETRRHLVALIAPGSSVQSGSGQLFLLESELGPWVGSSWKSFGETGSTFEYGFSGMARVTWS